MNPNLLRYRVITLPLVSVSYTHLDVYKRQSLYKYTRDKDDETRKELCDLKAQVAISNAVRPYQDKLIQCEIEKAFTAGINYTDRKTCKMVEGVVVVPTEPTITGIGSYCCFRNNTDVYKRQVITFTVTTSMNTASGTVNIPVTVDGKTFTKVFSYSIAFRGDQMCIRDRLSGERFT